MSERDRTAGQLGRVQKRLGRWRQRHGGRGRPIPEALWAAAVEAAGAAGVEATARALGVDQGRLCRRLEGGSARSVAAAAPSRPSGTGFVEVQAQSVLGRGRTAVRLWGRDGEQVEFTFDSGTVELTAVAQAFWSRGR